MTSRPISFARHALGIFAVALAPLALAAGNEAPFAVVQAECVRVGDTAAAALAKAPVCTVTKGRWFSTIDPDDFYQAQYCLRGAAEAPCNARALLLFANRAYTPEARLTLERVDPAGTEYDDPQVLQTATGYVLRLGVRRAGKATETGYYVWHGERWTPIDTSGWRAALNKQLPAGTRTVPSPAPDFESMQTRLALFRKGDAPCCPGGSVEVSFALDGPRLTVKSVQTVAPQQPVGLNKIGCKMSGTGPGC